MRYLQLAVPVLIVVVTVLLLTRRSGAAPDQEQRRSGSDTGIFVFILVIGAVVAAIAFFAIGELLS